MTVRFSLLSPDYDERAMHLKATSPVESPYRLAMGESDEEPPGFQLASGADLLDVVTTGYRPLFLISPRFQSVLAPFSGWEARRAEVLGVRGMNDYRLLIIRGRCGPIDNCRSAEVTRISEYSGKPYRAFMGLFFDESTWDGSDLFMAEGTAHLFVTEAVRSACEVGEITNIRFRRPEDEERLAAAVRRS